MAQLGEKHNFCNLLLAEKDHISLRLGTSPILD